MAKNESKFYGALENIFTGANIEGVGGFVNLLKIKSAYYKKILAEFQKQADSNAVIPTFKEEFFDRLYSFFERYFSESGSVYFVKTAAWQKVYEQVYTDSRDVVLFWKTNMLYYVKSDILFQDMEVAVKDEKGAEHTFFFDCGTLKNKQNNEKKELVFTYTKTEGDRHIFKVEYSANGAKTKTDEIRKALKKADTEISEDTLNKAFNAFKKQAAVDFFINKDAKKFLTEQLDLYLNKILLDEKNQFDELRLKQLKTIKDFALKIIDFISQFEDELVQIWNKPKFVLNSNYVITMDKLNPPLIEKLRANSGWAKQEKEWQELGMSSAGKNDGLFESKHLPIDTKYFKDMETEILSLFDDLDDALDGRLIHSENYQALNTLQNRYKEKIDVCYIDPPYNTAASEIVYLNGYKHSTWLTMMSNRLDITKPLLDPECGVMCCLIDDVEQKNAGLLLEEKFGAIAGTIVIRIKPSGRPIPNGFAVSHEYAIFVKMDQDYPIARLEHSEEQSERYGETDEKGSFLWEFFRKAGSNSNRADRPTMFYPFYLNVQSGNLRIPKTLFNGKKREYEILEEPSKNEKVIYPKTDEGADGNWYFGIERAREFVSEFKAVPDKSGMYRIYYRRRQNEGVQPTTLWVDSKYSATEHGTALLKDIFGAKESFSYPKSIYAVEDCLKVTENSTEKPIILDYFAGSGTTAHAVMNLNRADGGRRKYMLAEVNGYFDTVLLPRIKKVCYSDKWKNGIAQEGGKGISQFFKYYSLEQYEQTLDKMKYSEIPATIFDERDPFANYVFLCDSKLADVLEIKDGKAELDFDKLYPNIDFPETISLILGKAIRKITADSVVLEGGETIRYDYQNFTDEEKVDFIKMLKPLLWWGK